MELYIYLFVLLKNTCWHVCSPTHQTHVRQVQEQLLPPPAALSGPAQVNLTTPSRHRGAVQSKLLIIISASYQFTPRFLAFQYVSSWSYWLSFSPGLNCHNIYFFSSWTACRRTQWNNDFQKTLRFSFSMTPRMSLHVSFSRQLLSGRMFWMNTTWDEHYYLYGDEKWFILAS